MMKTAAAAAAILAFGSLAAAAPLAPEPSIRPRATRLTQEAIDAIVRHGILPRPDSMTQEQAEALQGWLIPQGLDRLVVAEWLDALLQGHPA